jgi:heat shock protein HtpX
MKGTIKTFMLLAAMTAIFMFVGYALGGAGGMKIAFLFALGTNFFSYWYSDKIVLKIYKAKPVSHQNYPKLMQMVEELSHNTKMPVPKTYIIENSQPNAFATGRNPANGAVAVTTGIMQVLNDRELRGVIAHELAHIKNRDTLIMTVTSTIAGALSMLANFAMFFGGRGDNRHNNPIIMIMIAILAPLAAMLVQMAISRTREYSADRVGAEISGDPHSLASALEKISSKAKVIDNPRAEENPATAHMFIINPLHAHKVDNLFSTHPSTHNRINALNELAKEMNIGSNHNVNLEQPEEIKKGSFSVNNNNNLEVKTTKRYKKGSFDF